MVNPHASRPRPAALRQSLRFAILALTLNIAPGWASDKAALAGTAGVQPASTSLNAAPRQADLGKERASSQTTEFADWVVDSRDNQGMPFMVIDKVHARVLLFDPSGRLQGAAPALLGMARGDDSTPGIGERRLSSIQPAERTTPAGRFVASLDRDAHGQELLWVDYDTALALHRVVKGHPSEQRAQRLESATSADNRISYGCINVPAAFYDRFVSPAFSGTSGVVYILPETRSVREVFGSYAVRERSALRLAGPPASQPAPTAGVK